jgi:outer membrane protein TolC
LRNPITTVWVVLGLLLSPPRAEARRYTLPELLEHVARVYPGVVAAREGQAAAQAQLEQAGRLWAPQGELTFGITGSPDVKCADAMGVSGPDKAARQANCITTTATDLRGQNLGNILPLHGVALQLNARLLQPLYTFGKIEAARNAAKAGVDVAHGQLDQARNDAKLWAVRAYYGLKWARASKSTLDEGRQRLAEWVKRVDQEIDKGKSSYSESDLIRLKLALDTAELVNLDIVRGVDIAQAGLRFLTGDPEADVDDADLDDVDLVDQPLSYYQDAARVHRPEARMLDAGRQAVRANRKLKLSEMLPDLGLLTTFSYGLATGMDDPQNAFMNRPNFLGAGLALAFRAPLDYALKLGKYDEARAQERMFEAKREQALGGIGLEVRKAWLDAAEARNRRKILAHSEKVARGWYTATDQALQTGVADARDLAESARNYFELRLRHLQALMDQNVTLCTLKNTAGLL